VSFSFSGLLDAMRCADFLTSHNLSFGDTSLLDYVHICMFSTDQPRLKGKVSIFIREDFKMRLIVLTYRTRDPWYQSQPRRQQGDAPSTHGRSRLDGQNRVRGCARGTDARCRR